MFASSKYLSPCPRAIVGGDLLSLERTKKYLGEARVRSSASASNPDQPRTRSLHAGSSNS